LGNKKADLHQYLESRPAVAVSQKAITWDLLP